MKATTNEIIGLHGKLASVISRVYYGTDEQLIEELMRASENKIVDSDGQLDKSWQ